MSRMLKIKSYIDEIKALKFENKKLKAKESINIQKDMPEYDELREEL